MHDNSMEKSYDVVFPIYVCPVIYFQPGSFMQEFQDQMLLDIQENFEAEFWNIFRSQLEEKHKKQFIRLWSPQEDKLLLRKARMGLQWKEIANFFTGKEALICQRRAQKLRKRRTIWPPSKDKAIKEMFEQQKMTWAQIQKHFPEKTIKQLRQHYKNFLKIQISPENWSVDEDIHLYRSVEATGKKWKELSQFFQGRTELQLKNRYYKTLEPLSILVKKKVRQLFPH